MAWYNVGTVTVTASSGVVTGAGTDFITNVRVGDGFTVVGSTTIYEITNIASATQITISPVFTGTAGSGKAYAIVPIQGYVKSLADQVRALLNNIPASGYAPIDSPTFTGTVTTGPLNAGAVSASSLYSSSIINAAGNIDSKLGFTGTPSTASGTTGVTLFNGSDSGNSGYLQMVASPTAMNIVTSCTGTGTARNLDVYTTQGVILRATQTGELMFPLAGGRIQGAWSNTPISARTALQTSIVNGNTAIPILPNGTSTVAGIHMYSSSTDPDNATVLSIYCNGAAGAACVINSGSTGTGTSKELLLQYAGANRINLNPWGSYFADGTVIQGNWSAGPGSFASRTFFRSPQGSPQTQLSIGPAINAASAQTVGVQAYSHPDAENSVRMATYTDGNICVIAADRTGTASFVPLAFYSGGAERFRITNGGEVLFGATGSGGMYNASVNNPGIDLDTVNKTLVVQSGTNATNMHLSKYGVGNATMAAFWVTGVGVGSISCSASNVSFNTASDYRLKFDVRDMPDCRAYIKELRPVLHYWDIPDADNTLPTAGFIAHELQEVFPQMVYGVKDGVDENGEPIYQGVDYGKLTPYLAAAVKSIIEENEEQADQIAILQEENRVLKLQMAAVLEQLNLTVDTTTSQTD